METPLSLLYTAGIAGDLALLPRLHTFLQRLKNARPRPCLLLDLGPACADTVWHCRATSNRSTLIALDAMGYQAANIEGALDASNRDKLAPQVTLALVDRHHHWRCSLPAAMEVMVALRPVDSPASLQILLEGTESTRLDGKILRLNAVDRGQVGETIVDLRGDFTLLSASIHAMPVNTPPNPSIAGAVEFIESEARYFLKQSKAQPSE